jgi:hypothetical protein
MEKKSNSWRLLGWILAAVVIVWLTTQILFPLIIGALKVALVVVVIGAIAYGAYSLSGKKSLGGGRRTLP